MIVAHLLTLNHKHFFSFVRRGAFNVHTPPRKIKAPDCNKELVTTNDRAKFKQILEYDVISVQQNSKYYNMHTN